MKEINWDLAPEGATAIVKWADGEIRWSDGGRTYEAESDTWYKINPDWETIAIRPTTEPRKTVKDAVDYFDGEWPGVISTCMYYSDSDGRYSGAMMDCDSYKVCTREEFEAYVAEHEGEKWTHVYFEEKCRIICDTPDKNGYVPVMWETEAYGYVKLSGLKPIRTLTRAEAEKELGCIIKD